MEGREVLRRLFALEQHPGSERRHLHVGDWCFAIEGLDAPLASALDRRWGGFLRPPRGNGARVLLEVFHDDIGLGVGRAAKGERYRIEGELVAGTPVVRAHSFALAPEARFGAWRCGLTRHAGEPAERVLENALRYLVARIALEEGGFALHAAAVLRGGRAFVFAGPSRAGKTTAVELSAPGVSLGDDFAVLLRDTRGWSVPAVPFDNAERAPLEPPRGSYPVAGIYRIHPAAETRLQELSTAYAVASLLGCAAFPWAFPELAESLAEHARKFVAEGTFAHLHFRPDPGFWKLLEART